MKQVLFALALLAAGCGSVVNAGDGGVGDDDDDDDDDDFDGGVDPSAIQVSSEAGFVRLRPGSETIVPIAIARPAGFTGEVAVELTGLPVGVAADAVVVPAGATTANLRLEAVASAVPGGPVAISAEAHAADDSATPGARALRLYIAGSAGSADLSFGSDGIATLDQHRLTVNGRAIDDQGRVLLATSYDSAPTRRAFIRFAADGTLDPSFGDGGLLIETEGTLSIAYDVAVDGDRIYGLNRTNSDGEVVYFVRRYHDDGSVDTSFGTGGDAVLPADARGLTLWGDLLVAGTFGAETYAIDASGAVEQLPTSPLEPRAFAVDAGGRLIAASGVAGQPPQTMPLAYLEPGAAAWVPYTITVPGEYMYVETDAVTALPDGDLLVTLRLDVGSAIRVRLVRMTAAGGIDSSFGDGGQVVINDSFGTLSSLVLDGEGGIVALVDDDVVDQEPPAYLRRFSANGERDGAFGTDGVTTLPVGPRTELVHDVEAGRVVVCGSVRAKTARKDEQLRCARYWL